jgi:RNA polymerase sigma factor (sigma-70 family)
VLVTPEESRLEQAARLHGPRVLAYLARRLDRREEAADLWQQTLIVVWRKIALLPEDDDQAIAWLIVIARGELANHRRAKARLLAATHELRQHLSTLARPVEEADHQHVHDALATLSDLDREIITLTYWDSLSSEQTGLVVGLSADAVRKRLQRSRAELARVLGASHHALVIRDPTESGSTMSWQP